MRRVVISSVLALIVSYFVGTYLFHQPEPHGPNSTEIKAHTYYDKEIGCYKMSTIPYVCPFAH